LTGKLVKKYGITRDFQVFNSPDFPVELTRHIPETGARLTLSKPPMRAMSRQIPLGRRVF